MKRGPWIFLLFTVALSGCARFENPHLLEAHGQTMGTHYSVKVVGNFPGGEPALQQQVDALLKHFNDEISTYDPNSMLSRFNQQQSTAPYPISQDMADILIEALRIGQQTDGLLDVTVGPLVNLWGFGPDQRPLQIPTAEQIAKARARIGINNLHVEISSNHITVRKDLPDIYVDLSTFGEGFGADKVAEFLESHGVQNYLIDIAGASRSRGLNGNGELWRLGIQKPTDEYEQAQAVITPNGRAVSTSGSYRNYYELDGRRYSHIIDPSTGMPITHRLVSATVIAETALEADGWDTALMVMGAEKAIQFAEQHHLAIYLVTKTDTGFSAQYSTAFAPYIKK